MIAALNKYYRPMTNEDFWERMDIPGTNNAIIISAFPEFVENWIFKKKRKAFEVF